MSEFSKRNRKVAINRWKNTIERQMREIAENSSKFPTLKARIIAYLMGDGAVMVRNENGGSVHYTIKFYPDDEGMANSYLIALRKVYGLNPKVRKFRGFSHLTVDSKAAVMDLLRYGSFRSLEWRVPKKVLETKKSKQEFLRAFYDCEGYVGPKVVSIQSVNQEGLKQIQSLLEEFGIGSKMYRYERKEKNWNTNFLLYITKKEDRKQFLKRIGFNHLRKQRKLQRYAGVA